MYFDLTRGISNLGTSGLGVNYISGIEGWSGTYDFCLKTNSIYIKKVFTITILAQAAPNTGFNLANSYPVIFTLEQYCGVNSGNLELSKPIKSP